MPRLLLTLVTTVGICTMASQSGSAQGFGSSSITPQPAAGGGLFGGPTPAPGVSAAPGQIQVPNLQLNIQPGRFFRKNRTAESFVGKDTFSNAAGRIVGSIQSGNRQLVRPAAADAVERKIPEPVLNPPRTPAPKARMYEPKLSVGFRQEPRTEVDISANLQSQIDRLGRTDPSVRVTTTVTGQTVHLEGEVGSEEQRELIEQMMLFEPGISSVQNDLRVTFAGP